MEKNLEQLQTIFEMPLISSLGYVNRTQFFAALRAARNGKETHIVHLLRTISLEFWLRDLASRRLIHDVVGAPPLVTAASLQRQARSVT